MHMRQSSILSRSLTVGCLLISIASLTGCSSQPKVTEKSISELLERVDRASENKDVDGIVSALADNAIIEVSSAQGSMSFNKETYKTYLAKAYTVISSYKARRTPTQFMNIDPNGASGTGHDIVVEEVTVNGKVVSTSTEETATFGIENGKVVITNIKGRMTVL